MGSLVTLEPGAMQMSITTTAEIMPMLSMTQGSLFGFTVYADRKPLAQGGLGKGRKAGTIVHQTLPGLLRDVARLCEEQGGSLDDLVRVLEDKAS